MTVPYPFQLADVKKIPRFNGRVLLCWSMGLGKSFGALFHAHRHGLSPVVVVCPASVKWVWQEQAVEHFQRRAVVLEGTKPRRFGGIPKDAELVILNYDILKPWLGRLKRLKPKLIVYDESHLLCGLRTQRTLLCKDLAESCNGCDILALSGTPLVNRPAELWPTLNILWPEQFPNFFSFAHRHCDPRRERWGWSFKGATRLGLLHLRLKNLGMLRRRKEDVLKDLPKKRRIVVPLDMKNRRLYDQAVADFLGYLHQHHPSKVRKARKAKQIVQLGHLKRLAAELKMDGVIEWVEDFLAESDGKLILFAVHRKVVADLHKAFPGSVVVDGSVTGDDRRLAVRKFLTNPRTRILIGNIRAAGVGWSAKGVSTVAFAEFPWAPGSVTQAEDRCHGLGRGEAGKQTTIYYLPARESIESKLLKILQDKQRVVTKTLDVRGGGDALDVYDLLERELQKEGSS